MEKKSSLIRRFGIKHDSGNQEQVIGYKDDFYWFYVSIRKVGDCYICGSVTIFKEIKTYDEYCANYNNDGVELIPSPLDTNRSDIHNVITMMKNDPVFDARDIALAEYLIADWEN